MFSHIFVFSSITMIVPKWPLEGFVWKRYHIPIIMGDVCLLKCLLLYSEYDTNPIQCQHYHRAYNNVITLFGSEIRILYSSVVRYVVILTRSNLLWHFILFFSAVVPQVYVMEPCSWFFMRSLPLFVLQKPAATNTIWWKGAFLCAQKTHFIT